MRVLIVDDEASIRDLLQFNLQKNGYETSLAQDGEEALRLVGQETVDLILLDIMLPLKDGFEVCRILKADPHTAHIPIIMLTARSDEIDKVLGLELGADDYAVKPFSVRELLARVKAVLRRSQSVKSPDNVLRMGKLTMKLAAYEAWAGDEKLALTPKEYELLKLFTTNPGRAFSREELLEKIWGYEYYGDTRTVDVHIRHLRAKLAAKAGELATAIETVRGIGYRFDPRS